MHTSDFEEISGDFFWDRNENQPLRLIGVYFKCIDTGATDAKMTDFRIFPFAVAKYIYLISKKLT